MPNSSIIPFYGVEGPANVGALVRGRVWNPDGSTAAEFPFTEEINIGTGLGNGSFFATPTLSLNDAVTGLPFTWGARQVPTQDAAGFDSPTLVLASRQTLGWVKNGILLSDPNLDAIVAGAFGTPGNGGIVITNGTPTSLYVNWIEFVNDYGMNNIVLASNKDQTMQTVAGSQPLQRGQPNFYAIQNAFDYATDEIHGTLYGGCLKIPLDFTPNGGKVPPRVANWAKVIAFCHLLGLRAPNRSLPGRRAATPTGPDYGAMLDAAYLEMALYKYGQWAQMPEAVQGFDGTPVIARNFGGGCVVRYMDGMWQFPPSIIQPG